jgi:hypothetical protein
MTAVVAASAADECWCRESTTNSGEGVSTTARWWTIRTSRARCLRLDLCHCGIAPTPCRMKIEHAHLCAGKRLGQTASIFAQIGAIPPADACRRSARSFNALAASPDVGFETLQRCLPESEFPRGNSRDTAGVQSFDLASGCHVRGCARAGIPFASVMVASGMASRGLRVVSARRLKRSGRARRMREDGCREMDARRRTVALSCLLPIYSAVERAKFCTTRQCRFAACLRRIGRRRPAIP